jgi:hypothetical protein
LLGISQKTQCYDLGFKNWGQAMEEGFSVWTVFNNETTDFPGVYVCRRFESYGKPQPHVIAREVVATGQTVEEVRNKLPEGLHCLPRSENDDPNIIETWI